ncbi:MAG TPA: histidine phosphatase family protein [Gaiellaceae bacterium]|nr:histidine phosphatase family protein [Gaiellaceae bacterium]
MTTILLARHGETDWNREGRFQGWADPPLNAAGRAQAVDLSVALMAEELETVYSSPLQRAYETAEVVAASHGLEPVTIEALREVDVGSWSGLTREEIEQRFPDQYARWLDYGQGWDDGETYDAMAERVVRAVLELAAVHDGQRILAVSHGGPMRAVSAFADRVTYAEARRRSPVVANAAVLEFAVEGNALRQLD